MRRAGFIFLCLSAGLVLLFTALSLLFPLPPLKPWSTLVEDRNGKFLQAFLASDDKWRLKTSPEEIPVRLKYVLIKKEDRWFYYHPGVNPFAVVRALAQNIVHGRTVSGASTITMQVARLMEPKERTYYHKIVELFRAFQLEWRYSKDEILGLYLSMAPLGGNVEGLKSASYLYYQTPLERLNIAQLIDLILIPNNPNALRPDRRPDQLFAARKAFALPWISRKLLTRQDSIVIWQTNAAATRSALDRYAPHFCLRVLNDIPRSPVIRTSLDLNVQRTAERLLTNDLRLWKTRGVGNGALIVIKNKTREVLAYAGSEDFADKDAHGQVDAVKALRSPGSTLKPFLYALEIEKGELTPKTRLLDVPYDAEGFTADNYDGTYSGWVFADVALRKSLNVPMIRLLHGAGTSAFVTFLRGTGFRSLEAEKDHLGLSMIVGGCGVTLEELAAAYASFPNGGIYAPLSYLRTPADADPPTQRAFSKSTAFMVTDILAGIDRPDIPNNFESSRNLPRIAFKTGTSYGRRDAWAIGYSADYTIGVWMGNVTNRGSADLVSRESAAPLLVDLFNSISAAHTKEILPQPGDVLTRDVCAESGLRPNALCRHIIQDIYSVRQTQDRICDIDRELMVSPDRNVSYCPSCLGSHAYRLMTCADYPPELILFWDNTGKTHASVPVHNRACPRVFEGEGPKIVSPSDNMTYYVVAEGQKLALQACSTLDVHEQAWYVDDKYLCKVKPSQKYFVALASGSHTVSCVDDKGRMTSISFKIHM